MTLVRNDPDPRVHKTDLMLGCACCRFLTYPERFGEDGLGQSVRS